MENKYEIRIHPFEDHMNGYTFKDSDIVKSFTQENYDLLGSIDRLLPNAYLLIMDGRTIAAKKEYHKIKELYRSVIKNRAFPFSAGLGIEIADSRIKKIIEQGLDRQSHEPINLSEIKRIFPIGIWDSKSFYDQIPEEVVDLAYSMINSSKDKRGPAKEVVDKLRLSISHSNYLKDKVDSYLDGKVFLKHDEIDPRQQISYEEIIGLKKSLEGLVNRSLLRR